MKLVDAQGMALKVMEKYGLTTKGWTFYFDRAKKRLGATHFHKRQISLSKYMVTSANRNDVYQTILHEVAHAMLPAKVGHGKEWKDLAKALGYTGARTATNPYATRQKKDEAAKRGMKILPADEAKVTIGSKLFISGKVFTVTKKNRTRYQATSDGRIFSVPFDLAQESVLAPKLPPRKTTPALATTS